VAARIVDRIQIAGLKPRTKVRKEGRSRKKQKEAEGSRRKQEEISGGN
jgi:hypothetical protein